VDIRCEMLLFMASRSQLIAQKIAPALAAGKLVLADRFISSTLAYQGAAGGLREEDITAVGQVAIGPNWPDLVVVFDVDETVAARRLNPLLDRMEQKGAAFHRLVREGYRRQAEAMPQRYLLVDASRGEDEVFAAVIAGLEAHLGANEPTPR
jgi:dTMP kinase